jgi:hypothetical protein
MEALKTILTAVAGFVLGSMVGFVLAWWIYAYDLPEGNYPGIFPDQTSEGSWIGGLIGLVGALGLRAYHTRHDRHTSSSLPTRRRLPQHPAQRTLSTRDAEGIAWALLFALFVGIGMSVIDFSPPVALVSALATGVLTFLFVHKGGDDHADR